MICGYTTFELERVPVRERWDRVRARAVASRRDARDDTIARRTTLVPTVRKRARAWLAKLGSRGGDRHRRVGAVGENDARVSSEARASLETHRHGPAPVPREDSSHALGHRLARPEVLLDAGPGRLSRARDARAIHRGAHAVPAEKRGATPRKIRPAASTPRRTKCARSRQVCQESERRKATKKRRCEFSSSGMRWKTLPSPGEFCPLGGFRPVSKSGTCRTLLPDPSQLERATQRCAPPPPDAGAFETRPPSGARARTALPLAPAARARVVPPFPRDRPVSRRKRPYQSGSNREIAK